MNCDDVPKHLTHGRVGVKLCKTPDISLLSGISQQYDTMIGKQFQVMFFFVHTVKPSYDCSINGARIIVIALCNEHILSFLPLEEEVSGTWSLMSIMSSVFDSL